MTRKAPFLAIAVLFFFAVPAASQPELDSTATATPEDAPDFKSDLTSARATMETFIKAMNEDLLEEAVKCLDLSAHSEDAGPDLASQLKSIIDHMIIVVFSTIPSNQEGEPYTLQSHPGIDVRMDNRKFIDAGEIIIDRGDDGLWRFTSDTLKHVESVWPFWVGQESVSEAPESFPVWLARQFSMRFRQKHFLLPDYQWVCLLIVVFLGFLADLIFRFVLNHLTAAWFRFVRTEEEYQVERRLWKPLGLLVQALTWYGGTALIGLPLFARTVLFVGLKIFAVVAAVWTAFLLINLLSAYMARKAEATATKFDDLLIPFVSKSLKVFVVCMGVLTCAQAFKLPIGGLLGGLGLGGMALALAAKDAVSNFFGSVTVLIDRPFEVGDWIVTSDVEGTVETVGFRSTRVRTFYNSLITVPNCLLTTAVVDNMGRRRYRRVKATLGLQYDTTPGQMEAFCEGVRELIRRHPYTRKDYYHVYFNQFSGSSLDVLLYCFVECPDWSVELRERHRLFIDIVRLANELGVSFAFPTRTLHMFQEEAVEAAELPGLDPHRVGQAQAARIAGPLPAVHERPGPVEFRGPNE